MSSYRWPLFVYPSRCCNYRCSYCFSDSGPEQPLESFLIARWKPMIRDAAALGVPEIRISGGEPLVLPAIEAMCRDVVAHGMRYTITTNGALLDRHLPWMSEIPPETLWISFHREYHTVDSFLPLLRAAVRTLPCLGLNVFASDDVSRLAASGVKRLKILDQTAVGRATSGVTGPTSMIAVPPGVEVRVEASYRQTGPGSCVLRDRPLLSIDGDGRAYACCVTVGAAGAEVGDLQHEPLAAIVARAQASQAELPCARLLPRVAAGRDGCPIRLYAADSSVWSAA